MKRDEEARQKTKEGRVKGEEKKSVAEREQSDPPCTGSDG